MSSSPPAPVASPSLASPPSPSLASPPPQSLASPPPPVVSPPRAPLASRSARFLGGTAPMLYRPLASPLHATRAGVAALWAAALGAAALLLYHPLALAVLLVAVVLAGRGAGVGPELTRALRTALIVALPIVLVNVLVTRDGLTVFARLGDLGPFGQGDLTLEALVYGAVIALKVTALILVTALASIAIDPDALLRKSRRLSFRSALTASLAIRMVPLLAADARRLAEAQRTRPPGIATRVGAPSSAAASAQDAGGGSRASDAPASAQDAGGGSRASDAPASAQDAGGGSRASDAAASAQDAGGGWLSGRHEGRVRKRLGSARERAAIVGAVLTGSLDRAMDVAATLEVRGFAAPRRPSAPGRRMRRPWSRHDLAFAASAVAVLALALAARLAGWERFDAYPLLHVAFGADLLVLCAALALATLLPFADRRGIEP